MIYFDNSATSFYKPEHVKNSIIRALNKYTANPGRSGHKLSIATAEIIYETREIIKEFFHAGDYDVVFTKNCTEALNLAICGTLKPGEHVITTIYEHNSILRPLKFLEDKGVEVSIIDCEMSELAEKIESEIKANTKLIITTALSNVTGEVCDITKIGNICKERNILYLVDGAQASGHIEIDLKKSNIDMYSFSGHKGLLSVTGVGGLIIKRGVKLEPVIFGGTGTESENFRGKEGAHGDGSSLEILPRRGSSFV